MTSHQDIKNKDNDAIEAVGYFTQHLLDAIVINSSRQGFYIEKHKERQSGCAVF